eukprot:11554100-Ditylum_brightwellii.AAC.1
MKASKKYKKRSFGVTYKFGIKVPGTGDIHGARELDRESGNTLWFDAQHLETTTLRTMNTFVLVPDGFNLEGYQFVPLIYTFDVKFDGRRKARHVANGSVMIGPPELEIWSGVVSTKIVRLAMFIVMLNGFKILAADISSAYLMAKMKEK